MRVEVRGLLRDGMDSFLFLVPDEVSLFSYSSLKRRWLTLISASPTLQLYIISVSATGVYSDNVITLFALGTAVLIPLFMLISIVRDRGDFTGVQ